MDIYTVVIDGHEMIIRAKDDADARLKSANEYEFDIGKRPTSIAALHNVSREEDFWQSVRVTYPNG